MSFYHNQPSLSRRFRLVLSSFLQKDGLPFADTLPEKRIEAVPGTQYLIHDFL
jgi:hypothetical protein